MADLKTVLDQLRKVYSDLSPKKRIFAISTISMTILFLIILIVWANRTDFKTIYTGLSSEDAGAVVNSLKNKKIPYKVGADGSTIMVPADKVYELRMELASEGLPQSSGIGYEIFDRQSIGVTEFIQKVNFQRALQGELSRTINQFAEVKSSRVHLTIPKESLFIEEQEKPRASIVLTLHPGRKLRGSQIQGIVHLVASSVESLSPDDVIIVDSHGTLIAGGKERFRYAELTASQQQIQAETEKSIARKVESMLGNVVGPGKAIAKVSVDMDFTQVEQTEESYDPETAAVRSEQRTQEKSTGKRPVSSGVPGVMSNTPDVKQAEAAASGMKSVDYNKQDETVNYEISRVTKRIINQIGSIDRLTAAVLIDGTYVTEKNEEGKEVRTYVPRNEEELKKYEALVKKAVGYDENRGDAVEVVNVQFHEMAAEVESLMERILRQLNVQSIITYTITAFLFALFFIFGLGPLIRLLSKTVERGEAVPELPEEKKGLEPGAEELPSAAFMEQAKIGERQANLIQFAKQNPRLFAQYLKTWLE